MTRKPVTSSSIASIGYDPQTLTLEVEFKPFRKAPPGSPNMAYAYKNVGLDTHKAIMESESIGSAVSKMIVKHPDKYPYKKVES